MRRANSRIILSSLAFLSLVDVCGVGKEESCCIVDAVCCGGMKGERGGRCCCIEDVSVLGKVKGEGATAGGSDAETPDTDGDVS